MAIEDPDSKAQEVIRDHAQLTREVLAVRLVAFIPGLGEVHGFGDITVKLYEEGFGRNPDDKEVPFFIAVFRKSGGQHEQSIWKFMPDNTVEREGIIIKGANITKYGKGFSDVPPHNAGDAKILLKLVVDPIANFSEAGNLSFLDGRARGSRTNSPRRSVGRR